MRFVCGDGARKWVVVNSREWNAGVQHLQGPAGNLLQRDRRRQRMRRIRRMVIRPLGSRQQRILSVRASELRMQPRADGQTMRSGDTDWRLSRGRLSGKRRLLSQSAGLHLRVGREWMRAGTFRVMRELICAGRCRELLSRAVRNHLREHGELEHCVRLNASSTGTASASLPSLEVETQRRSGAARASSMSDPCEELGMSCTEFCRRSESRRP